VAENAHANFNSAIAALIIEIIELYKNAGETILLYVRHAAEPSGWSCNGLLNYNAAALCVLPELMREAQRQFLVLFVNNSPQREEQTKAIGIF
jgi:hypothetical protein